MFIAVVGHLERDVNIKLRLKAGLPGYDHVHLWHHSGEIEAGRSGTQGQPQLHKTLSQNRMKIEPRHDLHPRVLCNEEKVLSSPP